MASVEAIELKHALATVIIVGFFNAEYLRIARAIQGQGLLESLYGTFGISVIAWLAFAVAVNMTLNAPSRPLSAFAGLVLGVSSLLILLPATALSSCRPDATRPLLHRGQAGAGLQDDRLSRGRPRRLHLVVASDLQFVLDVHPAL